MTKSTSPYSLNAQRDGTPQNYEHLNVKQTDRQTDRRPPTSTNMNTFKITLNMHSVIDRYSKYRTAVPANRRQSVKLHGILSKMSVIFVNFTKFAMPTRLVVIHVGVVTVTGVTADRHTVCYCAHQWVPDKAAGA